MPGDGGSRSLVKHFSVRSVLFESALNGGLTHRLALR